MKSLERSQLLLRTDGRVEPARHWSTCWLVSAVSYLGLMALLIATALVLDGGTLPYALDDAYIHLALARNWLRWQSIGISPGQIAVATSSPLWTAVVTAAVAGFGFKPVLPLLLNVAASLFTLAIFWWGWSRLRVRPFSMRVGREWLLCGVLPILLNLPTLTLSGMETVLHSGLTLAFVIAFLIGLNTAEKGPFVAACLLSAVLPLARFESIFLIAVASAILVWCKQGSRAAELIACSGVPVSILCLVMHAKTGLYLPNSVLIKGMPATLAAFAVKCEYTFYGFAMNPLVLVVLVWSFAFRAGQPRVIRDGWLLCGSAGLLHVSLSAVSGTLALDRYESYVIDVAFLLLLCSDHRAIGQVLVERARRVRWFRLERLVATFGLLEKGLLLVVGVLGTNDVYLQHVQLGRLIAAEFPHSAVVANDIGVVSLSAGGNVTDLVGLGSTDVLHAVRASGPYDELRVELVDPILDRNGADLIVIYPDWFSSRLYGNWTPVAAWSYERRQVTAGGRTVVFFARDPDQVEEILERLARFQKRLPAGVRARYLGTDFSEDSDLSTL